MGKEVGTGDFYVSQCPIPISASFNDPRKISQQAVQNLSMGYAPTFAANLTVAYQGKMTTFNFPLCVAAKMALAFKNEDFSVPAFDFQAFDNGSGQVMTWSTSE